MDAGEQRELLVSRAKFLMANDANVCCYSDLWERIELEITQLAKQIKRPSGYVMACLIDDIRDLGLVP